MTAKLTKQFNIRISDPEDEAYERVAGASGLKKGVWARAILNAAAGIGGLTESTRKAQRAQSKMDHENPAAPVTSEG